MFATEDTVVFFRNQFVPFKDATLTLANTGFLYGLGVFTGMRAHYNQEQDKLYLFRPADHYKRFLISCRLMRYSNFLKNFSEEKFISILKELLSKNAVREDVYIRVTNFTDEDKISPRLGQYKDAFSAFIYPLGDYVPTTGMRCKVSSWIRVEDNAIPARAKVNGAYVNTALAKAEAISLGFDEAIFLDRNGHVIEGSAENIFFVMDGKLVTPGVSDNILEGITRRSVIEMAKNLGIETIERSVDRTELYKADEIFMTGTGAKVSPVVSVDGIDVGDGLVGPVSSTIQNLYSRIVRGDEPEYMHWLVEC
ncbi:MAG: branched-chain amino acid transaminase [bacterium]|nr:branched-chain amino acid transaminase [bacterium]